MLPYGGHGWTYWGQNWKKNQTVASGTTNKEELICPYCHCKAYYIGIVPAAVECSNPFCKWYKQQDIDNEEKKNKYGYYD